MTKTSSEILQRLAENSHQPSESERDTPKYTASNLPKSHPLWTLWSRFSEIYGHQWSSQQGAEPNDTWVRGLDGFTNEQFGNGLRALLTRTETWPPNLIEFRQLCTGEDSTAWERQAHKIYEPERRLVDMTAKEAAEEAGRQFFARLNL